MTYIQKVLTLFCALLFFSQTIMAGQSQTTVGFDSWLSSQVEISETKLLEAISRPDAAPGSVIASPSKANPDYYYHWVRDAALVMNVVVDLYLKAEASKKDFYMQRLEQFVTFSRSNQQSNALTGLGEPKFYVDGRPYDLAWGRPQNDGPGLRALTLIRLARIKLVQGQTEYVRNVLYDGKIPTHSVIKADLEYVSHHWQEANFDLWEEVLGEHFYTLMGQQAALVEGAALARDLGDIGASDWYLRQSEAIRARLNVFLNSSQNYIPTTLNFKGGLNSKNSNLDVAVVLGILHAGGPQRVTTWEDSRIHNTLRALPEAFASLYPINQRMDEYAPSIGRYPEDVYGGDNFDGGNPWVLTTLALAEAHYELASHYANKKSVAPLAEASDVSMQTAREHLLRGDRYFQRVRIHANPDGTLSEQISRFNGYMISANNLTWSYASVLTANASREKAKKLLH